MTRYRKASREELAEMIRAHNGVVTAIISDDADALEAQLISVTTGHLSEAQLDVPLFAARMAQQVEAGARVTVVVLRSLAKRLGVSVEEVHEIMAQAAIEGIQPEAESGESEA